MLTEKFLPFRSALPNLGPFLEVTHRFAVDHRIDALPIDAEQHLSEAGGTYDIVCISIGCPHSGRYCISGSSNPHFANPARISLASVPLNGSNGSANTLRQ